MAQTVIGIFDSASQAQQAVEQLVNNGFMRGDIDISSQPTSKDIDSSGNGNDNDIHSNFFKSLLDDKDEANAYSDIARGGSIVTVHAQSSQQAQNAAQILDQYGTVDVNERAMQPGNSADGSSKLNNAPTTDADTAIPVIKEELQVGKRVIETGGMRLRSRIIERPVEEHLRLREEHVHVERHEVNRPASENDFATFKEGVIELTEHAEIPVVSKQAQVVEEISLSKEVEEHTETIKDTVRSTDIEVENLENNAANLGETNISGTNTAQRENLAAQGNDMDSDDSLLEKTHGDWQGTLRRMKEVENDYKVADDDPDVRGWDVMSSNGEKIGEVDELIVDTSAMKVRYLDIEVEGDLLDKEDNHILIPIGSATLDLENKNVMVVNLNSGSLASYPAYNGESISRDYEHKVMSALSPDYKSGSMSNDKFYEGENFNTGRFSGSKDI